MWSKNFLFRILDATPLAQTENEVFHDADQVLDGTGLQLEKLVSVWIQGDGDEQPESFTNVYVRTAMLDMQKRAGFLQPIQGRTHQIRQLLTTEQKTFLRTWLNQSYPTAWAATDEHIRLIFDAE